MGRVSRTDRANTAYTVKHQEIRAAMTDLVAISATLFGESRGESIFGQIAVGNTLRNRVRRSNGARTYSAVALAPWQFSCWDEVGPNQDETFAVAEALLSGTVQTLPLVTREALRQCSWVASGLLSGDLADDPVHSATHYLTENLFKKNPPSWAKDQPIIATVGSHVFLKVR